MSYKLVEGEVRLFYQSTRFVGSRPDGDSAWFKPDNPSYLENVGFRSADFNKGGFAQLRFEGIDALELHFPGSDHQLEDPAVEARNFLLDRLGFEQVIYAPSDDIPASVRDSTPVSVRASVMTRAIDPFGRPVSFVFPGNAPERSGSEVFLRPDRFDSSLNAALIREGHAYPAYYSARNVNGQRVGGLPGDLRDHLTDLVIDSYNAGKGVWAYDQTTSSFSVRRMEDLHQLAIWPKLYRRLAKFYDDETASHGTLNGFIDWLRTDRSSRDDLLLVIPTGELMNISDILDVTATTLAMQYEPEELVVVPR